MVTVSFAEDKPSENKKDLPKRGALSNTVSGVSKDVKVPDAWGGNDPAGKDVAPITGSVSKITPSKWVARIFNNSEDTYSVNLAVHQYNRSNSKIKTDSFSYTLKPKEKAERELSATAATEQASLELLSWSKKETAQKK